MLEFLLEENNLRPLLFSHGLTELDITFVKAGGGRLPQSNSLWMMIQLKNGSEWNNLSAKFVIPDFLLIGMDLDLLMKEIQRNELDHEFDSLL